MTPVQQIEQHLGIVRRRIRWMRAMTGAVGPIWRGLTVVEVVILLWILFTIPDIGYGGRALVPVAGIGGLC